MSKATGIAVAVVLIVLAGGGGFYGGMQYQKAQVPSFAQGGFGGPGGVPGAGPGGFQGQGGNGQNQLNRPVSGQVVSRDASSITVKLADGSTKIVMLSLKATIGKFSKGSAGDLKEGEQVTAFGTSNSDGSVTATMVQIGRPAGISGFRAPGANGAAGSNNSGAN